MTDPALPLRVLDALPQAVMVLDGSARLAFANAAFRQVAGVGPEACPPGSPLADLVRLLAYRGFYGPGDPEALAAEALAIDRARPSRRQVGLAGADRSYETASVPLPDGGFLSIAHDITPLVRAREEQAARARLLEATLSRLHGGVARYDAEMRLGLHNPAYEELLGLPGGTLRPGLRHQEVIALLEERGEFVSSEEPARIAALMEGDRLRAANRQRRRPGGEVLRFDNQPTPEGGVLIEVTDVTALQRAEDEARRRAGLLDGVLGALPHGVCVFGPDRRVAMFNDAYARIMEGAPVSVGDRIEEIAARRVAGGEFSPDYAAQRLTSRGQPATAMEEVVRQRPNGTVIAVRAVALPDGGHISVVTDVTALHRAQETARERATLLDAVLEALPEGVSVFGPDRRARVVNPAYRRIMGAAAVRLGESLEELADRRVAAGEMDRATADALLARHFGPAAAAANPIRRLRPDGTAVVTRAAQLPDGGHIALISDITPLHRAEEELRRRAAMLEASFGAIRHGIAIYDPGRRLLAANERIAELAGLPAGRFTPGRLFDELIAEQVTLGITTPEQAEASRRLDRSVPHSLTRHRADGQVLDILCDPTPDGGFVITSVDVTALHRAEEELRRRNAMLEASFAAMRHGFAIFGPDRGLLAANDRTPGLTGVPSGNHRPGRPFEDIVAEQAARGMLTAEQARAVVALDRSRPQRYVRQLPDGRIVEILSDPTPDGGFVITFSDVTALHRAEEELQRRAAMLEASFGAMRHGIAIYGADRRLVACNARFGELTGLPAAFVTPGRHFDELVAEQLRLGVVTADYAAHARALDFSRPVRVSRGGPGDTLVEVVSDPTPDGGYVVTFTDVTALHRAEEELQRRAAMLEASFGAMRHGIAIYGPDRRLVATNDRTGELTGIPDLFAQPGRLFDELVDYQVERGIMSVERGAVAKSADRSRPYRNSRETPDGRIVEIVSDPTPDGGFVVTFTDVTALRRAEQEIRHREAMQAAMLGTIRHGIILYGPDRRVLATNAKTSELTGMPPDRLLPGRTMDELLDEQVSRGEVEPGAAAGMKALDRSRPLRYGRTRPDGRVIDTVSEPTPDGGYVITYSDVTDDRRIRAELDKARIQAEAASEAKSRFLATMSHELRTPLNAVIGFSEAIAVDRDPARIADYAAAINEAGRHLLQLVDDILDVARSQTGGLPTAEETIFPAEVIEEATQAAAAAAASAGLDMAIRVPAGLPRLRGDARRLRQLLDKLLSNAVKFTPFGGSVEVSAELCTRGLEIRVTDTGIGIPAAERERMFEPFTQLDSSLARRFQGSGLGLHLARLLATALGGTLTLEGPEGPGITALLRFPADRLLPARPPARAGALPA